MVLWVSVPAPLVIVAILLLRLGHAQVPPLPPCTFKAGLCQDDPSGSHVDADEEESKLNDFGKPVTVALTGETSHAGQGVVTV